MPDQACAPHVPLLRVTRGQQQSLTSSVPTIRRSALMHVRPLIGARSSKLGLTRGYRQLALSSSVAPDRTTRLFGATSGRLGLEAAVVLASARLGGPYFGGGVPGPRRAWREDGHRDRGAR